MSDDHEELRATFERQGYVFPLEAMSPAEAAGYRAQLEGVEAAQAGRPELGQAIFGAPHLLMPFIDEIMRSPAVFPIDLRRTKLTRLTGEYVQAAQVSQPGRAAAPGGSLITEVSPNEGAGPMPFTWGVGVFPVRDESQ